MVIVPNVNLITNIGHGEDATHTKGSGAKWSLVSKNLGKIIHPDTIAINQEADFYHFKNYSYKTIWDKLYNDLNVILDKFGIKKPLIIILNKIGVR